MRRAAVPFAALALAACGGSDPAATTTERDESPALPSATPTPRATATASATGTPPTAAAPSAPPPPPDAEPGEGGAGDEAPARSPVRVVVDGEGITPLRTEVPAFLAVRVTVRNDLPRAIAVALRGGHAGRRVAAGAEGGFDVAGLQPGEYELDAGEAGRATIVAVRP